MGKADRDYYLARIAAERDAAKCATNEHARRAHLRMAEEYEAMLSGRINDGPRPEEPQADF